MTLNLLSINNLHDVQQKCTNTVTTRLCIAGQLILGKCIIQNIGWKNFIVWFGFENVEWTGSSTSVSASGWSDKHRYVLGAPTVERRRHWRECGAGVCCQLPSTRAGWVGRATGTTRYHLVPSQRPHLWHRLPCPGQCQYHYHLSSTIRCMLNYHLIRPQQYSGWIISVQIYWIGYVKIDTVTSWG